MRILFLFLVFFAAGPAMAHSLRVFAKVEGDQVSGYAFFIGGGRPAGVRWVARTGDSTVASGLTDADGGYSFKVFQPVEDEVTITVDTGEGHAASAKLSPQRFGASLHPPAEASSDNPAADPKPVAGTAALSQTMIEAAVERQVAPLMERIEAMDARMRFTDVMSGIFLIVGLAGMALWARGRRR